ncbi:MAG: VWA domain-containing protein, partial [Candidatus Limnocylindrales bacterium]
AESLSSRRVNRCLLLTQGLANQGITDPAELARHAEGLRTRGITTTTFGVGEGFDETLLQSLATAGGGHFYFIADSASIVDHITSEVGEALDIVARGATLEVTAPDGLKVESLSPYRTRERTGRTEISIGDLSANQQVSVILRLKFPYGQLGERAGVVLSISDQDGVLTDHSASLHWEYADDATNGGQERDRTVDRAVARTFAARAGQEAVRLNRTGDFEAAKKALKATARKIGEYAGRDTELRTFMSSLEQQAELMAAPMPAMALKASHAASSYALYSRSADGAATKAPSAPRKA